MIDLHCHVLPGVDDGPASMEETIALAHAARRAGIDTLVATPHVSADLPTSAETVRRGVEEVNSRLAEEGIEITVVPGGEIDIAWSATLDEAELDALRLGGGEWLLMECPLSQAAGPFWLVLRDLEARGYGIVLAHPERSPAIRRNPDLLTDLLSTGMLSSITAGSLMGRFGEEVRRFAFEMLEQGLVHNITSDAHDAVRRPPELRDARRLVEDEFPGIGPLAGWMTRQLPAAVLGGRPLPHAPALEAPRRRPWRDDLRRGVLAR